jgi:hypothetical protein
MITASHSRLSYLDDLSFQFALASPFIPNVDAAFPPPATLWILRCLGLLFSFNGFRTYYHMVYYMSIPFSMLTKQHPSPILLMIAAAGSRPLEVLHDGQPVPGIYHLQRMAAV